MTHKVLVVRRLLPASQKSVFEAWTDPDIMSRWFYGEAGWHAQVVADVRVGGSYEVKMITPDGAVYDHSGEYLEIAPHHRIVFTWRNDLVDDSQVTVELTPKGAHTELVLTHSLPEGAVPPHRDGWENCLVMLAAYLGGGGSETRQSS
jgi:uncharacterized protein YndB with AHSA1/START domain